MNLEESKNTLKAYYESGTYSAELTGIFEKITENLPPVNPEGKFAAVFDVDETVLNNYFFIKKCGFGYVDQLWTDWLHSASAPRIEESYRFYKKLVENGYKIIFLTGRKEEYAQSTSKNLLTQGYSVFDTLITRSEAEKDIPASDFKNNIRRLLTEKGYSIRYCVGDQESDLSGQYTGTTIKLPNYLYFVK